MESGGEERPEAPRERFRSVQRKGERSRSSGRNESRKRKPAAAGGVERGMGAKNRSHQRSRSRERNQPKRRSSSVRRNGERRRNEEEEALRRRGRNAEERSSQGQASQSSSSQPETQPTEQPNRELGGGGGGGSAGSEQPSGGEERGSGNGGGGNQEPASRNQAGRRVNVTQLASIVILYFNAQSIVRKIDELACITNDMKPDIVLVTESWCNGIITNAMLTLPGYDLQLRADREDTTAGVGGGWCMLEKTWSSYRKKKGMLLPVFRIRIRMDPHSIGRPDPDPHLKCGSGSRRVKKR
jgi:hypothetical protein